uniref:Uncharacterized protein LOC102800715 n=1 Tax=Saccoglossus kowalevskii TaxID=10224 RepID=A0ABM0MQE4_SACKO|nr:PREDICTED: uncharacterized protein LOC102800715 [Saccoglossus kowalevskii]
MSENTTLTEIVRDCVKGVLQLIIYVLDGNNGFRLEDQSVLGSLYDIAPDLSIFYVCNKIETNLSASRMDMASDDEDEDDASENPEEKKLRVFQSLVDYGFINSREKMKDCRFFHGISTREISRERRRGETGKNYSKAFDVMKQDFMFFAGQMLQGHMLHATNSLLQAQIHCFEFFILDALRQGIPNVTKAEELGLMIEELRNNRARLHKNARSALDARKERIGKVIKNAIEGKQDEILLAVQNMKYSPVRVGETVNRNEMVEQLQNQVQRLVVMKITQAVKESLQPEIEALVQEMTKAGDQQLEVLNQTAWEGFRNILTSLTFSLSVPKFSGLLNLTNISWSVARQWMVNDLPSKISAKWKGAVVDTKWRYKIAKETMERLNCKEMTEIVCKEIRSKIDKFFNDLHKEICRIETLNKASKMQEDKSRKVAADIAKELCQTIFAGMVAWF